jgi:hypothetical protein
MQVSIIVPHRALDRTMHKSCFCPPEGVSCLLQIQNNIVRTTFDVLSWWVPDLRRMGGGCCLQGKICVP